MRIAVIAAAALVALSAAGCSQASQSSPAIQAATSAPVAGTAEANKLVCQHYLQQRAWVKHLVQPTVADAVQFMVDVGVDQDQSSGKLESDLGAMYNDMRANRSDYGDSVKVYDDCT